MTKTKLFFSACLLFGLCSCVTINVAPPTESARATNTLPPTIIEPTIIPPTETTIPSTETSLPPVTSTLTEIPTDLPATLTPTPSVPIATFMDLPEGNVRGFSEDGRLVVMEIQDQGETQVIVYDRQIGSISTILKPQESGTDYLGLDAVVISADHTTLAFWAHQYNPFNLLAQDCTLDTPCSFSYIYDLENNSLAPPIIISRYGLGMGVQAAISGDGQFLALATNEGLTFSGTLIYNRSNGMITPITNTGLAVDISADGRYVAYVQQVGDNQSTDIYLLDRQTGNTTSVIQDSSGNQSGISIFHEGISAEMEISADGQLIVFTSTENNLVDAPFTSCSTYFGAELESCQHIYLYDNGTQTTYLISQNNQGQPGDQVSSNPSISVDGRFITFQSYARNLTSTTPVICDSAKNIPCSAVYIFDRVNQVLSLASVGPDGSYPDGHSNRAMITTDNKVLFYSTADNILPGYGEGWYVVDFLSLFEENE